MGEAPPLVDNLLFLSPFFEEADPPNPPPIIRREGQEDWTFLPTVNWGDATKVLEPFVVMKE